MRLEGKTILSPLTPPPLSQETHGYTVLLCGDSKILRYVACNILPVPICRLPPSTAVRLKSSEFRIDAAPLNAPP